MNVENMNNQDYQSYLQSLHEKFPDEEPRLGLTKSEQDEISHRMDVEVEDRGGFEGLRQAAQRNKIREATKLLDKAAPKNENKYVKTIKGVEIDVYDILKAYDPTHPIGHAIKKLLMSGNRGFKGYVEDLSEAIQAIEREIEMQGEG